MSVCVMGTLMDMNQKGIMEAEALRFAGCSTRKMGVDNGRKGGLYCQSSVLFKFFNIIVRIQTRDP